MSEQLQNTGQLQNNTVNGGMSITINCLIIDVKAYGRAGNKNA